MRLKHSSLLLLGWGLLLGCGSLRIVPTSPEVTTYRAVTAADTALLVIRPGVGALLVYCDSSAVWVASSNRVTGEGEFRVEWNGGADLATLGFLASPCLVATGTPTPQRPGSLLVRGYHDPYTLRPLRGAYVRLNFDTGDNDGGGLLDSTGQLTLSLKERTTVRNSGAIVDSQLATLQFPIDTTRVPPEVRARILAASKKMVYTYEHSDTLVQRGSLLELVIDSTTVTEVRLDTTRAQHQVRLYWPTDVAYTRKSDFRLEPSKGTKGALRLRIRRRGGGWRAVELYPHPQITGFPAACR